MAAKKYAQSRSGPKKRVLRKPSDQKIRLIDEKGEHIGIVTVREGLNQAQDKELDLVEVAPHLDPPTCKILDWGRFKYRSSKKQSGKSTKKSSKKRKEIQLRPKIERHDLETKLRHARRFLTSGHKVLVCLIFRGRELRFMNENSAILDQFVQELQEDAQIERPIKQESRNRITVILGPKKKP